MKLVVYLSLVCAAISFTVTESKLFKPLRAWLQGRSSFLGNLFSCGYCFGHWLAFILVIIYRPRLFYFYWLADYFLTAIVIAWLAGMQWIWMCLWLTKAGK